MNLREITENALPQAKIHYQNTRFLVVRENYTKATLNTQNPEITINYITHLLQQLTDDYKNTKEERKKLAT